MNGAAAYLWVAVGGALGSVARYALGNYFTLTWGSAFPWGTLLINGLGSFVISFFGALTLTGARLPLSPEARLFVAVGLCGGFTTFSAFSLQTVDMLRAGHMMRAALYVAFSAIFCITACAMGYAAAAMMNGARAG